MTEKERHQHRLSGYNFQAERVRELAIAELGRRAFDELSQAKSNAAYHYLGSGKIMAQIGEAFAISLSAQ